jgi:hypothetical protein
VRLCPRAPLLRAWRVELGHPYLPGMRTEWVTVYARTAASARIQARHEYQGRVVRRVVALTPAAP